MRVRVTWPDGRQREVEVHTLRQLDTFVGWHLREGRVDLRLDGDDGFHIVVER